MDGGQGAWHTLEDQGVATFAHERSYPGHQIGGDATFPQDAGQYQVVDIIETCLHIEKEGGHLQAPPLQGFHVIQEREARMVCAQPREGRELVLVN